MRTWRRHWAGWKPQSRGKDLWMDRQQWQAWTVGGGNGWPLPSVSAGEEVAHRVQDRVAGRGWGHSPAHGGAPPVQGLRPVTGKCSASGAAGAHESCQRGTGKGAGSCSGQRGAPAGQAGAERGTALDGTERGRGGLVAYPSPGPTLHCWRDLQQDQERGVLEK